MTANQPVANAMRQAPTCVVPFPVVDEVSRHCLIDEEPETTHLEVHLPLPVDRERIRTAFHRALLDHPRVLMRQAPSRWYQRSYRWELTAQPDTEPVNFPEPGPQALFQARARALAWAPSLQLSPPLRLDLVDLRPGEHREAPAETRAVLVLTMHHTAVDVPAGLRILATTATHYGGRDNSPAQGKSRSTPAVHGKPATPQRADARRWLVRAARPARLAAAPAALVGTRPVSNSMLQAELPLPPRWTRGGDRLPWTVNDQLLVAAALMVGRWNRAHDQPVGPVRISMPIDGRPRGMDMQIGNGTRLVEVPVTPQDPLDEALLITDDPDPAALTRLLHTTARRTAALKSTPGTQLGAAGLLTTPLLPVGLRAALTRGVRRAASPWVSTTRLSNLGRVPYPLDFGDAGVAHAVWFSGPAHPPRGLSIGAASTAGRLHVTLRWSQTLLGDSAGSRLAQLFEQCLAAATASAA